MTRIPLRKRKIAALVSAQILLLIGFNNCAPMTADQTVGASGNGSQSVPTGSTPAPTPNPGGPTPVPTATPVPTPSVVTVSAEIALGVGLNKNQYQTDLAVSPVNSAHMTVTAKVGNNETEGAIFSTTDSGATWNITSIPNSGDHDIVYDGSGNAHVTFIDKAAGKVLGYMRSTDGGKTWSPKISLGAYVDHPHVMADLSASSPRKGAIYAAGRRFSNDGIDVAASYDEGKTWTKTFVPLGDGLQEGFVYGLAVSKNGTLLIPMTTKNTIFAVNGAYAGSTRDMYVLRSTDGGKTFTKVSLGARVSPAGQGAGTFAGMGNLAIDANGSGERVYLTFAQTVANGPATLTMITSDDLGLTWGPRKVIVDPALSTSGVGSCSAMINKDGVLGIQYFSINPQASGFEIYFTYSKDRGATFSAPLKITGAPSLNQSAQTQPRWFGQDQVYASAAGSDGLFHLVWPDGRASTTQLTTYTRSVKVP